ncbi:ATP-binding protein [Aquimarina hainanensis]|uniref:ATP-binding protein n=1 Tax=Aquimarina hainanensis TaxID=1578017 RepID=UPI003606F442
MWKASGIQKKKFEEKLKIEKELEEGIKEQLLRIQDQEEKIATRNKKIGNQQKILSDQKQEIQKQKEILNEQLSEISTHKKINLYLIILMMLLLLAGVFVYRSYLTKKRLNKELKQKNIAINKQSLELASKNQELEQFAYIASHDLQEPLNTISSFIGLLAEDYKDTFDETGKESLGFIQDASIRMKNLIDALLQYSRLGRGKDIGLVDSNVILRDLKKDLKDVVEKSKASLVIANSLPILEGNEIELRLLFQNLISNGIKFRNKEVIPEIVISSIEITKEGKKYWKFSVEDNGIGIPEKHQERIFAIFQRLHSKDKYPGTGIGLAHCKKIVESHGGEIWLESSEGEGSTFFLPSQDKKSQIHNGCI